MHEGWIASAEDPNVNRNHIASCSPHCAPTTAGIQASFAEETLETPLASDIKPGFGSFAFKVWDFGIGVCFFVWFGRFWIEV